MSPKLWLIFITFCLFGACKSPEARRPVSNSSSTFINQSIERNKKLIADEEAFIEAIIENDSVNDYIASESGFWYFYNSKDTTTVKQPILGDLVNFTYDIKTLDGAVVLSETENGIQNYRVDQSNQDLISGIRDGIKLMRVNETVTFLFPSHKAYGYYGIIDKLGTNIPVQSTITLKSINSTENN